MCQGVEGNVDIILPVAGLGTRLRPQTWSKPKPLVSVAGKPMLEHVLDRVMPLNPDKLVFITGFLGDQIESWARATYDIDLAFVVQPEMLGQTDAILRCREISTDDAVIIFPDMIFEADFSELSALDIDGAMYTKEVADPSAFGIAIVQNGRITKVIEKPEDPVSNLAVVGINYFRHMPDLYSAIDEQMAKGIKTKNEYFIADAIQIMIDRGKKFITQPVTVWEDCGNAEALLHTNTYLLQNDPPSPAQRPGAVIIPPSYVARSATIENAVIGPYSSIGNGAVIRDAVVRGSIVDDDAIIEGAILEHSLIGRKARIAGHAARLNAGDTTTVAL